MKNLKRSVRDNSANLAGGKEEGLDRKGMDSRVLSEKPSDLLVPSEFQRQRHLTPREDLALL